MSTSTAAPTINVTAEEVETFRVDPYFHGTMSIGYAVDVVAFDKNMTARSLREHREYLEAARPTLERWITVLQQLENGVLVAAPWIIEEVRGSADALDPGEYDCDESCADQCASEAERRAALYALADRLEGALAGAEVPA
jgi:hypothetical protein